MGRVTSILPQANTVEVGIQLDRDFPIYEGSHAEIQPKELMGGKQIEIVQGPGPERMRQSTPIQGKTSLDFSSAFSQMGSIMDQVNNNKIEALVTRMDSIFAGIQLLLSKENIRSVSRTIDLAESSLGRIDRLSRSVEENELIEGVDSLVTMLASTLVKAEKPLGSIDHLTRQADSLLLPRLVSNLDSLSGLINRLSSVAESGEAMLQDEESLVARVTQDAVFAKRIDSVLVHLTLVLKQIREEKIIVGFKRRKK
ncbi:MAG: MlaD family protein, partial [Bacteroidota bacterium]